MHKSVSFIRIIILTVGVFSFSYSIGLIQEERAERMVVVTADAEPEKENKEEEQLKEIIPSSTVPAHLILSYPGDGANSSVYTSPALKVLHTPPKMG